jgi:endonuclease/exonuclease/phosphatase family metal-dependent hydrolase
MRTHPHRRGFFLNGLIASAFLAAACGSSSPNSPSGANPELRVMTFNIQHGLNGAGKYGLDAAVQTIARVNPDLVGVQELTRNHPYYNCDDQPTRIADMLSQATGRRWTSLYQQEWFTPDRECQNAGRGDGPETEGIGFFAPEPLGPPMLTNLWNARLGVLTMLHRGRDIPVIVTHLASGTDGQSDRLRQLSTLVPWSMTQGGNGPTILIGDFNSPPGSSEYDQITSQFRDAWADGMAAGLARGRMDGITHKSSRIDYVFYVPANVLELKAIENISTAGLIGTEASDHNPLVATFAVK